MGDNNNIRRLRDAPRESVRLDAVLFVKGIPERTTIKDISKKGLGLIGNHAVKTGDFVIIQMMNGRQLEARVHWRNDEHCGLELTEPIGDTRGCASTDNEPLTLVAAISPPDGLQLGAHGFIGQSDIMRAVYNRIERAATSKANVFITGQSGTGKEVCAEAIHRASSRREKPFVAINCAAIPRDLFESEIFGHVKGAFTGASSDRLGAALEANSGTLFLDEIGELELSFQSKLLRFLQAGMVKRVGEDRARACDIRIICATNKDPRAEVAGGRFRDDLFYRLHVIPIALPPLRDRGNDVLSIATEFLRSFALEDGKPECLLSATTETLLLGHAWPGNIRELQNVARCIVAFNEGPTVDIQLLQQLLNGGSAIEARVSMPELVPAKAISHSLDEIIERTIDSSIRQCDGSISRAAMGLKVSPSTIYRHLQARKERLAG